MCQQKYNNYEPNCQKGQISKYDQVNKTYTCVPQNPIIYQNNKDIAGNIILGGYSGCNTYPFLRNILDADLYDGNFNKPTQPIKVGKVRYWRQVKENFAGVFQSVDYKLYTLNTSDKTKIGNNLNNSPNLSNQQSTLKPYNPSLLEEFYSTCYKLVPIKNPETSVGVIYFTTKINENKMDSAITLIQDCECTNFVSGWKFVDTYVVKSGASLIFDPDTNQYNFEDKYQPYQNLTKSMYYLKPVTVEGNGIDSNVPYSFINDNNNCGKWGNKCGNGQKCCGEMCVSNSVPDEKCYLGCPQGEYNEGGVCVPTQSFICPDGKEGWLKRIRIYTYIVTNPLDTMSQIGLRDMGENNQIVLGEHLYNTSDWYYTPEGKILSVGNTSLGLAVEGVGEEQRVILSKKPSSWFMLSGDQGYYYVRLMDNPTYGLVPLWQQKVNGRPIVIATGNIAWKIDEINVATGIVTSYNANGDCNVSPAGYYINLPSNQLTTCPAGSYCPIGTIGANSYASCPAGSYCPIGSSSPQPCPAGSYCPNPTQKIQCPNGSYSMNYNLKYSGKDQDGQTINTSSQSNLQNCQNECNKNSNCNAVIYYDKPRSGDNVNCFTIKGAPSPYSKQGSNIYVKDYNGSTSCSKCPENTLCLQGIKSECPNSYCPEGSMYDNYKGMPYPAYYADYGNVQTPYKIGCGPRPFPSKPGKGAGAGIQDFTLVIFISPKYNIVSKNVTSGWLVNNTTSGSDIPMEPKNMNWYIDPKVLQTNIQIIKMKQSGYGPDITLTLKDKTNGNQFTIQIQQNHNNAVAYTPSQMTIKYNGNENTKKVINPIPTGSIPKVELYAVDYGFDTDPTISNLVFDNVKISAQVINSPSATTNWCVTASKVWIS